MGSTAVDHALSVVNGDRNRDYGDPYTNHSRTARLWSGFLGIEITARDVCILNLLQKVSRLRNTPDHEDSIVDWIGWGINYERCAPR